MLVKLEWLAYRTVKKLWQYYVKRFSSNPGTSRTDRRTDRIAISISHISVLTRDKNTGLLQDSTPADVLMYSSIQVLFITPSLFWHTGHVLVLRWSVWSYCSILSVHVSLFYLPCNVVFSCVCWENYIVSWRRWFVGHVFAFHSNCM